MEQTFQTPDHPTNQRIDYADMVTRRVRELNDAFRQVGLSHAWGAGHILLTPHVSALGWADKFELMSLIRTFDTFNDDNDPHGEHDFGSLDYKGVRYFWKIDYYDKSLKHGSPDPSDTTLTVRVLTVMRAEEY